MAIHWSTHIVSICNSNAESCNCSQCFSSICLLKVVLKILPRMLKSIKLQNVLTYRTMYFLRQNGHVILPSLPFAQFNLACKSMACLLENLFSQVGHGYGRTGKCTFKCRLRLVLVPNILSHFGHGICFLPLLCVI